MALRRAMRAAALRLMDEEPRAVGALDPALGRKVEIHLGMAERAAAAVARGDHAVDVDRLERLHRNLLSRGGRAGELDAGCAGLSHDPASAGTGLVDPRRPRMIPIE